MKSPTLDIEDVACEALTCIVDDHHGQYMAQKLVEWFDVKGLEPEDLAILQAGPEHEFYDETADMALQDAYLERQDGSDHAIMFLDGGIFAVDWKEIEAWEEATGEFFWESYGFHL